MTKLWPLLALAWVSAPLHACLVALPTATLPERVAQDTVSKPCHGQIEHGQIETLSQPQAPCCDEDRYNTAVADPIEIAWMAWLLPPSAPDSNIVADPSSLTALRPPDRALYRLYSALLI
jgi:hypothetical protein